MKQSIKGLLLSGLVLPGMGQFALRRRKRGVAVMGATLTALVVFVVQATRQALDLLDQVIAKG